MIKREYLQTKFVIIFLLGLASGLPLALTASTMLIALAESGLSKTVLGFFAYVGAFYSLKFLWAPIMDGYKFPIMGKIFGLRRGWLLAIQSSLIFSITALGIALELEDLYYVAIFSGVTAFLSASQDIVVDAYRIETLPSSEQAMGAVVTTFGYRIGMLTTTAGALVLADILSWSQVYIAMSLILCPIVVMILFISEPNRVVVREERGIGANLRAKFIEPFVDIFIKKQAFLVIIFIVAFKLGDAIAGVMTGPFLIEVGFSKTEIASIVKTYGLLATFAGMLLGGILARRIGIYRSLWVGGILQIISNLAFLLLARIGYDPMVLLFVISVENFSGGVGSSVFVAYISILCNIQYTGTQYALLSSLSSVGRTMIAGATGVVVDSFGWVTFFIFSTLAGIPGIILLMFLKIRDVKLDPNNIMEDKSGGKKGINKEINKGTKGTKGSKGRVKKKRTII